MRYVKDAALMLDVIKGPLEADKNSLPNENINYLDKINQKPKNLKISYSLDLGFIKAIDPEVEKTFLNNVQKFEQFGWTTEEAQIKLRKADLL